MMQYGDKGYKAIDTLQRTGDFFRGMFNGRYKFIENGDDVHVVKRKGLSKTDYALTERDFSGILERGNKKLLRRIDKYNRRVKRKSSKDPKFIVPKNIKFYVGNEDQDLYDPKSSKEAAINLLTKRNYVAPNTTVERSKKWAKVGKNIGKYVTPVFLLAGGALKLLGAGAANMDDQVMADAFNSMGNDAFYASIGTAATGVLSSVRDANIETYRKIRKDIKDMNIDFIGKTNNSENYSASITRIVDDTGKSYRILNHNNPGAAIRDRKKHNKEKIHDQEKQVTRKRDGTKIITPSVSYRLVKTVTAGTPQKVRDRIEKTATRLSKKYTVVGEVLG